MKLNALLLQRVCSILLLFTALSVAPASAQGPPYAIYSDTASVSGPGRDSLAEGTEPPVMRSCDKPSEPVGPIVGDGRVTYEVTSSGRSPRTRVPGGAWPYYSCERARTPRPFRALHAARRLRRALLPYRS